MYQLFTEKYRPSSLKEFQLDDEFISFVEKMLHSNILNTLIIGGQGVGKTTILDIIKSIYYNNVSITLKRDNTLAMDQMKDTSVAYFRSNMKTFCQSYCTIPNKKKLIIIDDIDNINEQCQQILRSYIDHYSNNVMFILSCNSSNKVLNCIQSRLHILHLPNIKQDNMKALLSRIIKNEKIQMTKESQNLLLAITNNSIRKLYGYLQLFHLYDSKITKDNIFKLCNCIPFTNLQDYFRNLYEGKLQNAIIILKHFTEMGYSCIDIYEHILTFLKYDESLSEDYKYFVIQKLANYMRIFYEYHEDIVELALFTNSIFKYENNMYIE